MDSKSNTVAAHSSTPDASPKPLKVEFSPEGGSRGGGAPRAAAGTGPRRVRQLVQIAREHAALSQRIANGVQPGEVHLTLGVGIELRPRAFFLERMKNWCDVADALDALMGDIADKQDELAKCIECLDAAGKIAFASSDEVEA